VPEYLLDAAGNLVDIISSDVSNSSSDDYSRVTRATEMRRTLERAVRMIDRIMIVIFQVGVRCVDRLLGAELQI